MTRLIDLTGKRFGRLLVIKKDPKRPKSGTKWICQCDCGRVVSVFSRNLRRGTSTSCGCYKRDNPSRVTHGMSGSRLYGIWSNMKTRCENPKSKAYGRYGGRGIKICDQWQDPSCFFEWAEANGYEESLTIERIDNDKGYSPENCRWASREEQGNNKSNNRTFTLGGKTQNLSQWCREFGLDYTTAHKRIFGLGWSFEKAMKTPIDTSKRNSLSKK